ncbi:probable intracellular pathogenesis-related protein T1 [Salvia hispanica]|uniref:probable intracellular pathogenesis-related protein T1 n=1 Tax=Salvia hispanica TaxID=49212 RepID=UPI0020097FBA|nr:probable intracellular pathogenesis-related protein T1 [Salvia hispanica]
MVAITYDIEIPSSVAAAKMFKAMVLDADILIPKIMPQAIKNVEIVEGDGGAGTVKIIHFGEGSQFKSAKHRVEAIDKENLTHTYSIVDGDALAGVLESITYHICEV